MIARIKALVFKLLDATGLRPFILRHGAYRPGHYYSPVPSRSEVNHALESGGFSGTLAEVDLRREQQLALLQRYSHFYPDLPFSPEPRPDCRYHYEQTFFRYSDAIFLYCFLRHFKPKRVIEIGSGLSSALMLDTLDHDESIETRITFIEPYPDRLKRLLREGDLEKHRLVEKRIQDVELSLFETLESGDLLFIDSSHVLKYGSDLYRILFEILPTLPVGIYVHFHDIFYPFEYPEKWLRMGRYWNECYLLRAFLAHNDSWEITLFNQYVNREFGDVIEKSMPLCQKDFGGSCYIRRAN